MNLENRILELCRRAVAAKDEDAEWILAELKAALRKHILQTRRALFAYPFVRLDSPPLIELRG